MATLNFLHSKIMNPQDLYILHLVDGLPSQIGNQPVRYKIVHLRETTVADDRRAAELAQKVMSVRGKPTLMMVEETFTLASTMLHIVKFSGSGLPDIGADILDLDIVGKLNRYDWQLIEERCMLIELAAQHRYKIIDDKTFHALLNNEETKGDAIGPRHDGDLAGMGDAAAVPGTGPAMLADLTGNAPQNTPAVYGADTEQPAPDAQ